jgi:hypothetical protein
MKRIIYGNEQGGVTVVVAACLFVLVAVLAFTINTGYLYSEKNRYQRAVEAAAMAGAISVCETEPEEIARQVLLGNLMSDSSGEGELPADYTLDIAVGFYDESGSYDFSGSSVYGFKSFVEKDMMPEDVFENAVLVILRAEREQLFPGVLSNSATTVAAAAVAYAVDFDILSLSDANTITFNIGKPNFPTYRNMRVHGNNDVKFTNQQPEMDNVTVTATGSLYNCSGVEVQAEVIAPEIDWEEYRDRADVVLTYADFEGGSSFNDFVNIGENRGYVAATITANSPVYNNPVFELHEGNHQGTVYYYSAENDPDGGRTLFLNQFTAIRPPYSMTNFTLISEIPVGFSLQTNAGGKGGRFGGTGDDLVTIISAGSITLNQVLNSNTFDGVVFRTEDSFSDLEDVPTVGAYGASFEKEYKIKVLAQKDITFKSPTKVQADPASLVYLGQFTRPCDHHLLRWGRLE